MSLPALVFVSCWQCPKKWASTKQLTKLAPKSYTTTTTTTKAWTVKTCAAVQALDSTIRHAVPIRTCVDDNQRTTCIAGCDVNLSDRKRLRISIEADEAVPITTTKKKTEKKQQNFFFFFLVLCVCVKYTASVIEHRAVFGFSWWWEKVHRQPREFFGPVIIAIIKMQIGQTEEKRKKTKEEVDEFVCVCVCLCVNVCET